MMRSLSLLPPQVLRVLKLAQTDAAVQKFADMINPAARTLAAYVTALFYAWHLLGCVYWRAAFPPGSSAWAPDAAYATKSGYECYLYAFYWAVGTTSGTAAFAPPENAGALSFTLIVVIIGLFM